MPIFLVRWPDLSAALVRAGSEDALIDILDEVANPEGCTWSVYCGPLFIEFSLPVHFQVKDRGDQAGPLHPEDVVMEDVSGLGDGGPLEVSLAGVRREQTQALRSRYREPASRRGANDIATATQRRQTFVESVAYGVQSPADRLLDSTLCWIRPWPRDDPPRW